MARRTVMSQIASAGEEALGKLTSNSVTHKALEGAMQVKDRVEKLVSGLADIDGRVSRIEQRLADLEKPKRTTRARATASKSTSKPRAAAKKKTTT
jgi:predicted  nucleic acid-binding Zn-ribbon protein